MLSETMFLNSDPEGAVVPLENLLKSHPNNYKALEILISLLRRAGIHKSSIEFILNVYNFSEVLTLFFFRKAGGSSVVSLGCQLSGQTQWSSCWISLLPRLVCSIHQWYWKGTPITLCKIFYCTSYLWGILVRQYLSSILPGKTMCGELRRSLTWSSCISTLIKKVCAFSFVSVWRLAWSIGRWHAAGAWEEKEGGPVDMGTSENISVADALMRELKPKAKYGIYIYFLRICSNWSACPVSRDALRFQVLENYCLLATKQKTQVILLNV